MSVLTVAEAKTHFASVSLPDPAIQTAIDDIESEIVARFGAYYPTPVVQTFSPEYGQRVIVLRRRALAITSIVETLASAGSPLPTVTLDPTDYRLRAPFMIDRLANGPNVRYAWSAYGVTITYVPVDDTASRKIAVVDVLKVEWAHSGFTSRRIGDYAEATSSGAAGEDVTSKRDRILRRLRPKKVVMA